MDIESDAAFTNAKPSKNYAKFYPKWRRNNAKSEAEGKEIGEYQDFVMIVCPGLNKDEWHGRATPEIQREYPEEWRAYKEGREQRISGTPLELLPGLDSARVDMYKAHYVYTIEQLAELSEPSRQKFGMGTLDDMKKAQVFMQRGIGETIKLQAENAELRKALAELTAKVEALAPQKRGRKPRQAAGAVQ